MEDVLLAVPGLKPGFLQIDLQSAQYKIRYDDQVIQLILKHAGIPINPIIEWVKSVMIGSG